MTRSHTRSEHTTAEHTRSEQNTATHGNAEQNAVESTLSGHDVAGHNTAVQNAAERNTTPTVPASLTTHRPARGSLTPVEVATCGILSGLSVVLGVLSAIMPLLNLFFQVLSAIPVAMIAAKLRPRVGVTAVIVTVVVSLVGGASSALSMFQAAVIGATVGWLYRKSAGWIKTTLAGLILGALAGVGLTLIIWLLTDLRTLYLESIRVSTTGYLDLFGKWSALKHITDTLTHWLEVFIAYWWVWVPISMLTTVLFAVLMGKWILGAVLARIRFGTDWDPLNQPNAPADDRPVQPLPVNLDNVTFRYPGASADAVRGVTLTIQPGQFTIVQGPNGSGKSTLALVLAGAQPSTGTVTRPGAPGLGQPHGTALLAQRSELQMLGDTVAEDALWGLTPEEQTAVDLPELLELVGLEGLEEAQTRHLSGGQLQRLALAGALVRRPSLLISDESTAMIDQRGRADMMGILAKLPARGTTVVHITHDVAEASAADRLIRIESGLVTFDSLSNVNTQSAKPVQTEDHIQTAESQGETENAVDASLGDNTVQPRYGQMRTGITPASGATATEGENTDQAWSKTQAGTGADTTRSTTILAPWLVENMSPAERGWDDQWADEWKNVKPTQHLWVDRVSHTYNARTPWENTVLHDVSLIVNPGDAILISGGNGSGKTTLSRIMTGLMRPTGGKCTLGGEPMTQCVGQVGLSMQFARLQLQRPTVSSDILAATRAPANVDKRVAEKVVRAAMDMVGLPAELEHRNIDQLSGGQMRRVALAGLFASHPAAIVLDEPFAGLDLESRAMVTDVLAARRKQGLAVVVISHDTDGLDALVQQSMTLDQGVLS